MKKHDDLGRLSDKVLIQVYTADALEYSALDAVATQPGATLDYVAATAASRRCSAVYGELQRRGPDALRKLLGLLTHPDEGVRGAVAALAMSFAPEDAEPVLQAIVDAGGLRGFMAKCGLDAWKANPARDPLGLPCDTLYRTRPTMTEAERWPPVSAEAAGVLAFISNRLDADSSELAEAFRRASLEKRRQVAVHATEAALAEVGLSGDQDEVEEAQYALRFEALPAHEERERMDALAARLDAEAVQQRQEGQVGVAEQTNAEARAATALAIALTGDSTRLDEVIHEAIAAWNQPEGLIAQLTEMLRV